MDDKIVDDGKVSELDDVIGDVKIVGVGGKKNKERKSSAKPFKLFFILSCSTIMFAAGVYCDSTYFHKEVDEAALVADALIVDPQVKIVTEYQKSRYSSVPIELAEIQANLIVQAAKKHQLPVSLIVGMVEKESHFNPFSKSSVGATGLMQIFQAPGVEIDNKRRHDLAYVLDIGCNILKDKYKAANGSWSKALSMYSGYAEKYAEGVYENMGRFAMFEEGYGDAAEEEVAMLSKQLKSSVN